MAAKPIKKTRKIGAPAGPRNSDEKIAMLIDTAKRLFVDKGYDKTTMDEVAAEANVAKGTLYHYFKNKVDLLNAMRTDFEKEIMSRITPKVESCLSDDHTSRIKAWVDASVEAYFELSELHDVVIYGAGMPFRSTMADAEITRSLQKIITEGAQAGAWSADDPHWSAVTMFYSFRGGCDEAMLGTVSKNDVAEKLKVLFLRILGV